MYNLANNPFKDLMKKFEANIFGRRILFFLIDIGFEDFVYRIKNRDYLKKRCEFYSNNEKEVEENIELLADDFSKDTYKKMIEYRCKRKRRKFPKYSTEDQYFQEDIIKIMPEEVFVDCGAFNGDTTRKFIKYSNNKFKKVVCFEPDKDNYKDLCNSLKEDKRIVFYNNSVDEALKKVKFLGGEGMESIVTQDGNTEIDAVNLDSIEDCLDATFIKMDIEGLELEALKGAKKIIKNNKPKLAICIYHSDNDMINIIKYIHNLIPSYKLYIRQHSIYETETVLYCI